MRYVLSALLLSALLLSIFGSQLSFMLERHAVRSQMQQMLKAEKRKAARQFVFTQQEFAALQQYENGREFSLNGNMYDVVSKEVRNGQIVLTAFFDHKETSLIGRFVSLFEEENASKTASHSYQKRISLPEFVWQQPELFIATSATFTTLFLPESKVLSYTSDTQSPPPDFIVV